jgi:YD repeat-containing protein
LTRQADIKSTGATITSFDYRYDNAGNRTVAIEADGARVTWLYDNIYQLTGEHRTGSNAYRNTFTFDPAGNRLVKNESGVRTTSTYDAANQIRYALAAGGRTTSVYDANGNQRIVQEPSGAVGSQDDSHLGLRKQADSGGAAGGNAGNMFVRPGWSAGNGGIDRWHSNALCGTGRPTPT